MSVRPLLLATSLLLTASRPVPAFGQAMSDSTRSLAATASEPWVPSGPIPAAQPWETAVRLPGMVASIPFSMLGLAMKGGLIFVESNDVVPKVVARLSVLQQYGVLAGPASLGDRTGWGGLVGINPTFLRAFTASASGSTGHYSRASVALGVPGASIAYQSDWRPQDLFFGVGAGSRHDDESSYASQTQMARVELRYPLRHAASGSAERLEDPAASTETHRPARRSIRAWAGPRDLAMSDGRERTDDSKPLSERFPALASTQLGTRVEHFVYGAEGTLDYRSGRPHWWKGWRTTVSAERYDAPLEAFAFHSASTPSVEFTRLTYEAEAGVSFWRDPRTFRIYGQVIDQTGVGNPGVFVLPDLVSLGGGRGLSGFEAGRLQDADLVLGRVSYIFPLARYLETDVHAEAGTVVPRLEHARLNALDTSYGVSLRVRSPLAPLAAAGVEWSRETVRFRFAIGGVE